MFAGVLLTQQHPVTPGWYLVCLCPLLPPDSKGFATTDRLATTVLLNEANKGSLFVTAHAITRHGTWCTSLPPHTAHPVTTYSLHGQLAVRLLPPIESPTLS